MECKHYTSTHFNIAWDSQLASDRGTSIDSAFMQVMGPLATALQSMKLTKLLVPATWKRRGKLIDEVDTCASVARVY